MRVRLLIFFFLSGSVAWSSEAQGQNPAFGGAEAQLRAWLLRAPGAGKQASAGTLSRNLQRFEVVRLDGGERSAAVRFGALLLDPSFGHLAGSPDFDALRYHLAAALAEQGATGSAREIFLGILAAKPPSTMQAPAWRKLADISLSSGQLDESLGALSRLGSLDDRDARSEVAYLQGKALALLGHTEPALAALRSVERDSRRFAQAVFLSGVLELDQGRREAAEDAFCKLVHHPGEGQYTFYFNDKTEQVLQSAWLALARLRHDAGEYPRALETYRQIDPLGPAGVRAAYESSWTLFRMGRMRQVRRQLRALLERQVLPEEEPSARLLLAYATLGDCLFEQSRLLLDRLERDLAGVAETADDLIEAKLKSPWHVPAASTAWLPLPRSHGKLRELRQEIRDAQLRVRLAWSTLRRLLRPDEPDLELGLEQALAASLEADLARADALQRRIADARSRLGSAEGEQIARKQLLNLLEQVDEAALRAGDALARLREAEPQRPDSARAPDVGPPAVYVQAEIENLARLRQELNLQATRSLDLEMAAAEERTQRLSRKVKAWSRQTALGRVDAVMGEKQALEVEIQNLALGRYPLSLLRELIQAGHLDDDLEYWPYDGEEWPDEYE